MPGVNKIYGSSPVFFVILHPVRRPRLAPLLFLVIIATASIAHSQLASPDSEAVHVTVSLNADGSRTVYSFDTANRKATATTTGKDRKPRGKIEYLLDGAGRFASGEVFGPDSKLRFRTEYKYNSSGQLAQETQLGVD